MEFIILTFINMFNIKNNYFQHINYFDVYKQFSM